MRSQEFFNIIADIDERFVNEVRDDVRQNNAFSETQRPQILRPERSARKAFFKPLMCGAACLAIAGGAALGFATFARSGGRVAPADVPSDSGTAISGAASSGVSLDNSSGYAANSDVSVDEITDPDKQSDAADAQYVFSHCVDRKYKGMDGMDDYYHAHYEGVGYQWGIGSMSCSNHQLQYDLNCVQLRVTCDLTDCDVYSLDGGKVVYAGASDFGNLIIIKHTDDDYSAYGYLGDLFVNAGDCVENGTVIARSGSARNYVNDADRDKLRCDIMMLRLDREFTLDEWNVYSAAYLEDDIKLYDRILHEPVGRMGEYYNTHYNDLDISRGHASSDIGSMVVRPSAYEYGKNCDVLDIKLNNIGSDIYTMDSGKVVYAGASNFGSLIIIKHADDDYSAYGYLGEMLVKTGDNVRDGDVIAKSGSARNYSDKAAWDVTVLRFDREITLNEWNDYSALVLKTPWHSSRSMQLSSNGNN